MMFAIFAKYVKVAAIDSTNFLYMGIRQHPHVPTAAYRLHLFSFYPV